MIPFSIPFAIALVCVGVLERVVHVVLLLFTLADKATRVEAKQLITHFLGLISSVIFGFVGAVLQILSYAGTFIIWFLVLFFVLSLLYVSYESYPVVWVQCVSLYNQQVGPFMHTYFLLPLQVLNLFMKGILPLYNSVVYFWRIMLSKGMIPLVVREIETFKDIAVTLLLLGKSCSVSLTSYVQVVTCQTDACLTQVPELDLLGPMSSVSNLAVLGGKVFSDVCSPIGTPVQVLLYPLTDPTFANAVHKLINGFLALVVYLPIVTKKRCAEYGATGGPFDVLMCTPDVDVVKIYLIEAVRGLGQTLDAWLAVGYAAISAQLTGVPSKCDPAGVGVRPDMLRNEVFDGAMTTIGLTDWLLASTNGSLAAFFSPGGSSSTVTVRAWGGDGVDVSLGVAAVSYGVANQVEVSSLTRGRQAGSGQSTTILGCR